MNNAPQVRSEADERRRVRRIGLLIIVVLVLVVVAGVGSCARAIGHYSTEIVAPNGDLRFELYVAELLAEDRLKRGA